MKPLVNREHELNRPAIEMKIKNKVECYKFKKKRLFVARLSIKLLKIMMK